MNSLIYFIGFILALTLMSLGMIFVLIGLFPPEPTEKSLLTLTVAMVFGCVFWAGGAIVWKWSVKLRAELYGKF